MTSSQNMRLFAIQNTVKLETNTVENNRLAKHTCLQCHYPNRSNHRLTVLLLIRDVKHSLLLWLLCHAIPMRSAR